MESVDSFKIDSDERGFELVIETDEDSYRFNCHAVAPEILQEVQRTIGQWWAEAQSARYSVRVTEEDLDGYELNDPKRVELQRVIDRGGFA